MLNFAKSKCRVTNLCGNGLRHSVDTRVTNMLPIVWATSIVTRARKEGRIRDDFAVKTIIDELNKFRGQAGLLLSYDTISVPLVYTQVSYMIVDEMHHEHPELIKDQYWDEVFPSELPYTIATENQREEHPEPSTARVAVPPRQRSMVTVNPSSVKIDEMVPSNTQLQMNDDAQSGIHFIVSRGSKRGKRDERNSMGSSNSMASLQPMTRNNSVTSMLKRLFSKEDQRANNVPSQTDGGSRFMVSASNPTLNKPVAAMTGSMKIANDVIEEVDEQATITSMGKRPETRPTAMSLFAQGPPTPSEPVNVPTRNTNHTKDGRLSSSAPAQWSRVESTGPPESPAVLSLGPRGSFPDVGSERPRLDSDVGPSLSAAGSQILRNYIFINSVNRFTSEIASILCINI
ncbi:unnamed protein product [Leptidea sinapis]|uniref:Bestrophin homolog n=1 Tax=Leptidea sinapis TaxID=189913 RepID=A0A5E4PVF8_9NEOP|nr:unnamed protein product [Leptidea sinapis]